MTKAPEHPIELTPSDKSTLKGISFSLQELIDDMEQIGIRFTAGNERTPTPYLCDSGNEFFDRLQSVLEEARTNITHVINESIDYGDAAKTPV